MLGIAIDGEGDGSLGGSEDGLEVDLEAVAGFDDPQLSLFGGEDGSCFVVPVDSDGLDGVIVDGFLE